MFIDLHTHSTFSDGGIPPDKIIDRAYGLMEKLGESKGLLSICDHNNTSGIGDALKYVETINGVEDIELYFLPGAEIDSEGGRHILAYFSPEERAWERNDIQDIFDKNEAARDERNKATIDQLKDVCGILFDYDELYCNIKGIRTRFPIVEAVVACGCAQDIDYAKKEYFNPECPAYVAYIPPFSANDVVQKVANYGVLTVIAHPRGVEESEIQELMLSGLNGIEVMNAETHFRNLDKFAHNENILRTIGSDCHFRNNQDRFGYSVVHNRGGREKPTHYNISQQFFDSIKGKIDEDILPLLNYH